MGEDSNFDREIIDRLARIETKLDNVKETERKADSAYNKAVEAYDIAVNNRKDIAQLNSTGRWVWQTIGSALVVAFIAALLTIV